VPFPAYDETRRYRSPVKKLFDTPSGRCVLHTWGGNGWQFTELTAFGPDGYAVLEDMCGGIGAEPLDLFITRLTGLSTAEANNIATEITARWRDSGEEAEQSEYSRNLRRQVRSKLLRGASTIAAVAGGVRVAKPLRRHRYL
jgi:hypothetical protein